MTLSGIETVTFRRDASIRCATACSGMHGGLKKFILLQKKKTQGKRASVQTRVLVRAVPKCIVLLKRVCDENMEECPRLALLATDEYDAPDAVLLR